MMFEKPSPLAIMVCPRCHGVGTVDIWTCRECRGMAVGIDDDGTFVYFGASLNRYHISLARAERILGRFEVIGAMIFGLGFLALFFFTIREGNLWTELGIADFWLVPTTQAPLLLWSGVIAFFYMLYRMLVITEPAPRLSKIQSNVPNKERSTDSLDWARIRRRPRRRRFNLATALTNEARVALEQGYLQAHGLHVREYAMPHLFYALLSGESIAMIFLRLGVSTKVLQAKIHTLFASGDERLGPVVGDAMYQTIFRAYRLARDGRQESIYAADLLLAAVEQSPEIQEVLYDSGVDADKLSNVIAWVRIRERLHEQFRKFREAAVHVSKYGIDRAMTAVATPFLNTFSQDLTLAAKFGYLTPCVAREREIDEVFRIIDGGRQSVILVGDHGVGKMTIIEGIAARMIEGSVPKRLQEKRLVQLSASALLAGTTVEGAEDRLIRIMREISRARNIILFINNIQDLMSVNGSGQGLDVAKTLAEYLDGGRVLLFATTTPDGYNRHVVNSELGSTVARVEIGEAEENQAIQMLEAKAGHIEYEQRVFFSYDAIATSVLLAKRFLHDQRLPESALTLMTEAATMVRNKKGESTMVGADAVAAIVSDKTGIPATSLTADESTRLMSLEAEMHKRVIGQDEAVASVANALRRARAEIRSIKRPIANFLFLGPTGVGKTELAKTIAEVYFGGENQMVRIDMSEFQDASGVYRLIGQPGEQGTGLLTEAVRQRPFSLVLLDEIEKADPNILNLFLQVMDDGRLTDSVGRVIDFTNTIIIATSNAGTAYVQEAVRGGTPFEAIKQSLLRGGLKEYFRPEFLNRFDGIILFRSLEREQMKQVARLMLARVEKDLDKRGVGLRVEEGALERLADVGFDPEFGARPMRRAIEQYVEDALAKLVIAGQLKRRDVVVLRNDGSITVESAEPLRA